MLLKHNHPNDECAIDFLKGTGQRYYGRDKNDVPFYYIAPYHVWYKHTPDGFDGQWPNDLPEELHKETVEYFERMLKWYKDNPPKFKLEPNFNEAGYRTPALEELSVGMECELYEIVDWYSSNGMKWIAKTLDEKMYKQFMEWDGKSLRECRGLPTVGWIRVKQTPKNINNETSETTM